MSDKAYDVPAEWAKRAWVNLAKYQEMYQRSITDPEGFWAEHGKRIDWFKPFSKVKNTSFDAKNVSIKWFEDGVTNVAHNCIDRHLPKRANQTAIIWEGDDPSKSAHITYAELARRVGLFANVLKSHGVKKGDRVTIYLPMIPEAAYAMLACARIGAIHSVVFGGFSSEAIADVGWVTGHSDILYGPLANGATTLMFEGVPNYPSMSRFWEVIDKHKVNTFYTAPTAIRSLMGAGEEPVKKTSRASLRLLGSVGEPINPEAWEWYHRVVGDSRCPVVDTWWQTETGGILISPLPGATKLKPGSATRPFFGVIPEIVDAGGKVQEGACEGNLVIADSWPGQSRTVFGDHARFVNTYFAAYPSKYFTGDGARRDAARSYWITGRVDDVINVSGHRMGTAEVESALVAHPKAAEAAVVGSPHDLKGQGIYAYVTLKLGEEPTDSLRKELIAWVRKEIGPIASPDAIQWAPALPKTRSGKIMRRILRKIAANDTDPLGDTSTLADPGVVTDLVDNRVR